MAETRRYRVTIVAVDENGYADLDTYGEEIEMTCSPNDLLTILAQLVVLETGIVRLDDFLRSHVEEQTRQKLKEHLS